MTRAIGIDLDFTIFDGLERLTITTAGEILENRHAVRFDLNAAEVAALPSAQFNDVRFFVPRSSTAGGQDVVIGTVLTDREGLEYTVIEILDDSPIAGAWDVLTRRGATITGGGSATRATIQIQLSRGGFIFRPPRDTVVPTFPGLAVVTKGPC